MCANIPFAHAQLPHQFWSKKENHKQFFDWVAHKLNLDVYESWYVVTSSQIIDHGGRNVLKHYDNSLYHALSSIFCEIQWLPWKFQGNVLEWWLHEDLQVRYIEWLATILKIRHHGQWYRITKDQIVNNGGAMLLSNCNRGSIGKYLTALYPEVEWQPWRFDISVDHLKLFVQEVAQQLDLRHIEDWYGMTTAKALLVAKPLAKHVGRLSMYEILQLVFPNDEWQPWRFEDTSPKYWKSKSNAMHFLSHVAKVLHITDDSGWYSVTEDQLASLGGKGLLAIHGNSLCNLMQAVFDDRQWQVWRFAKPPLGLWEVFDNHVAFFDELARYRGQMKPSDWYGVTLQEIHAFGGQELLKAYYNSSHVRALATVYPTVPWQPWRFHEIPRTFWDVEQCKKFFAWAAEQLKIVNVEDWYSVTETELMQIGGHHILNRFKNSLYSGLRAVFPDVKWQPWRFKHVPTETWTHEDAHRDFFEWLGCKYSLQIPQECYYIKKKDIESHGGSSLLINHYHSSHVKAFGRLYPHVSPPWSTHREFFEWLAEQLEINSTNAWGEVTTSTMGDHGGGDIIGKYSSVLDALSTTFPHSTWHPWIFGVSHDYWKQSANVVEFFEWLGGHLDIWMPEQWYKVPVTEIFKHGGKNLLQLFNKSPYRALLQAYPDVSWQPWRFSHVCSEDWEDRSLHRKFFDWLAEDIRIKDSEDWYELHKQDIITRGGGLLLEKYEHSHIKALLSVYPHIEWQPWRFVNLPYRFWQDNTYNSQFFEHLEDEFGIDVPQDWHRISMEHLHHQKAKALLAQHGGSLLELLRVQYPLEHWDATDWRRGNDSLAEKYLASALQKFIGKDFELEHKGTSPFVFKYFQSGRTMQFDMWIPQLNMFVEYQGQQHYMDISMDPSLDSLEEQYLNDWEKEEACEAASIEVLQVPFWWANVHHSNAHGNF